MTSAAVRMVRTADDGGAESGHGGDMNFLVYVIIGCEIGFWVLLAGGLAVRYLLGAGRLGLALLACVPLLDIVLLLAAGADLARGGEPDTIHGLAAFYLGFSVAFGHALIKGADVRFAHRFAGGPAPVKTARGTRAHRRGLWVEYARVLLAAGISVGVLLAMIVLAPDGSEEPLWDWIRRAGLVAALWLVAGPVWGLFERPARDKVPRRATSSSGF